MTCTECGALVTFVTDSRGNGKGDAIRRRRECFSCGHRFSTYEIDSDTYAVAIEGGAEVAQARKDAIEQFTAALPKVPGVNPMKIRPQRRSG